jgi:hypothetical protein
MPPYEQAAYMRGMAHARAAIGDQAFDQTWREGREMRFEDAMKYALGDDAGRPD